MRKASIQDSLWVQEQIWPAATGNLQDVPSVVPIPGVSEPRLVLQREAIVLWKTSVYAYTTSNSDHLRIQADAWGEVDRCSLNNASNGL